MTDFLDRMARASRERVDAARASVPIASIRDLALSAPKPPALQQDGHCFGLIAEVKRRAPSSGDLVPSATNDGAPLERATAFQSGGASAISVLSEPTEFRGSLKDIQHVSRNVAIPVMRKDFLVDPYQVFEARAHGAGGILLIARMIPVTQSIAMLDAAHECGLFSLIELFDELDLDAMSAMVEHAQHFPTTTMVGVNTRNLRDLSVDRGRLARMSDKLPSHLSRVAESGIDGPSDVADAVALGYNMALVGSALMRSTNPSESVAAMVQAGREAMAKCP